MYLYVSTILAPERMHLSATLMRVLHLLLQESIMHTDVIQVVHPLARRSTLTYIVRANSQFPLQSKPVNKKLIEHSVREVVKSRAYSL